MRGGVSGAPAPAKFHFVPGGNEPLEEKEIEGVTEPKLAYEGRMAMASHGVLCDETPWLDESACGGNYDVQFKHAPGASAPDLNSFHKGDSGAVRSTDFETSRWPLFEDGYDFESGTEKRSAVSDLGSVVLGKSGHILLQHLLEVLPLRSQCTGRREKLSLFPLPTSREVLLELFPTLNGDEISWMICVLVSLNSLWGCELFFEGLPNKSQVESLKILCRAVQRFCLLDAALENIDWSHFLSVKSVDYKGDEVRVARHFRWQNIQPALPKEIGRVPLADVCERGCKEYVINFDRYLRPLDELFLGKAPRVMVDDSHWGDVCVGLVQSGICQFIEEHDVFQVQGVPLLNGLFGVSKEEWTDDGTEIFRLIMNLIPLNKLCLPLSGDVGTLPAWSSMSPFFLQPSQTLLVSSEDVKCFFYTMSVPQCWVKYLAFNKLVPEQALPPHLRGKRVYVASQVLPMGFLNSVSLAQHVHRNLVKFSEGHASEANAPEGELRKDLAFTVANLNWRVYLDNYDLLERVEHTQVDSMRGTLATGALALRNEYEKWEVPRNIKKSVQRSDLCEVQGATVDGQAGIAYPVSQSWPSTSLWACHWSTPRKPRRSNGK